MSNFQDGSHSFGILVSPATINGVNYVLEQELGIAAASDVVEIKGADGGLTGRTIIPAATTLTGRLQLATNSTAIPSIGITFAVSNVNYQITQVGESYNQGAYNFVNITALKKIN
jgi:hypothetical protein